nr:sigma factor [Streptomyces antioxidans]
MSWTAIGSSGAESARERALHTLYDEQAGPPYAYVVRLLGGDRYRAEDVVQETLLRCWRTQDLNADRPLRP